jgi:hypothetical protein
LGKSDKLQTSIKNQSNKDMVVFFIIMDDYMKDNCKMILNMVKDIKYIQIILIIKDNMKKDKNQVKDVLCGVTDKFMMVSG